MSASADPNSNGKKKNIIIDIDSNLDAYSVDEDKKMIHRGEFETVVSLIEETLNKVKNIKSCRHVNESAIPNVTHDTIFLSGVRGSGKTTFMLSVMDFLKSQTSGTTSEVLKKCGDLGKGISVLGIIDPTIIEDKENILIIIIARIDAKVTKHIENDRQYERNGDYYHLYKQYEEIGKKLADGLDLVDGVGKDAWLDSQFVMEKDLKKAKAGSDLVYNFHKYLENSLQILDQKAFLLCLDDIDTHFSKGKKVIKVLHKFLTTPRMITMLSGDFLLYSTLVRSNQWDNYTAHFVDIEMKLLEKEEKYDKQVTILEQQYMLKIFRPERRIPLTSVMRKIELGYDVEVEGGIVGPSSCKIEGAYEEIFKRLGVKDTNEHQMYLGFIASRPIRTQKQFINKYYQAKRLATGAQNAANPWTNEQAETFAQGIADIFWSDLHEKGFEDVYELKEASNKIVVLATNYLIKGKLLADGHSLRPVFDDDSVNGAQFAVGFLLTLRFNQKHWLIFDYLVKTCAIREMRNFITHRQPGERELQPSLENIFEFINVQQGRKSYFAKLLTTYFSAYHMWEDRFTNNKFWHGIIPLKDLASTGNKEGCIDAVSYGGELQRQLAYLPLSGVATYSEKVPVYSFVNLLGAIEDILFSVQNESDGEGARKAVLDAFRGSSSYAEYAVPSWASKGLPIEAMANKSIPDVPAATPPKNDKLNKFVEALTEWALSAKKEHFKVIPLDLARIYMRSWISQNALEDQIENIEMEKASNKYNGVWDLRTYGILGNCFERFVVEFLNAVIAITAISENIKKDFKGHDDKVIFLNTANAVPVEVFYNNLRLIKASEMPDSNGKSVVAISEFGRWMLNCPIWSAYLDGRKSKDIATYFGWDIEISVFDQVNQVHIRQPQKKTAES